MKLLLLNSIAAILLLQPIPAFAAAAMQPLARDLLVNFTNGDSIAIRCDYEVGPCNLYIRVNGTAFQFTEEDLGNNSLTPASAKLYSGVGSGGDRENDFSFLVSVDCPEREDDTEVYNCYVGARVGDGKLTSLGFERRSESYVTNESNQIK